MSITGSAGQARHIAVAVLGGAAVLVALAACDLPLDLGQPTTRALESGAADSLAGATSFEMTGSYNDRSVVTGPPSFARGNAPIGRVDIDLQLVKPGTEHVVVTGDVTLEAIVIGDQAYFRGHEFLAQHMGSDPLSQNLVKAAGNAWWKGSAGNVPRLPNFTDGSGFRATFLGPVVTQRFDRLSVDGTDAVELSGPRADVFIAANSPFQVLRVHLKTGVVIDGITDGDFRYSNFNKDFQISPPSDVIDFSNLSTLTPIYTVVSVDTSGCGSPCAVSAVVKNLGGLQAAKGPSTVTFTMSDSASGKVLGGCQAQVRPDVPFNATTAVGCTIGNLNGQQANAAIVTATADNPGRA